MKIRVVLDVDIDERLWAEDNDVAVEGVPRDVRLHILGVTQSLALIEEANGTVELGR